LTVGQTYDFDLFFAERHTVASTFRIDTSIGRTAPPDPDPIPEPATMALLGLGSLGAGVVSRRLASSSASTEHGGVSAALSNDRIL